MVSVNLMSDGVATIHEFDRIPRVLRLDLSGQPIDWVTWQEAVCLYAREIGNVINQKARHDLPKDHMLSWTDFY